MVRKKKEKTSADLIEEIEDKFAELKEKLDENNEDFEDDESFEIDDKDEE